MELWNNMTVWDNVTLGPECYYSGLRPWGQVLGSRWQRTAILERSTHAVELCGISELVNRPVGICRPGSAVRRAGPGHGDAVPLPAARRALLGTGRSREPAVGEILTQLVAETGLGILLVEHDMALVSAICRYVYVLDFGRRIFEGTMAAAMSSELVRDAYLGTGSQAQVTADA